MLIFGILGAGILFGGIAQLILGREDGQFDWGMALVAGIGGSFVGGLIFSLIAGDGFAFKASGLIGSIVGAVVITAIWQFVRHRQRGR